MAMQAYRIDPRDPVLFRDGRPFTADPGACAHSLELPLPSVLAGTIRTRCGKDLHGRFDPMHIDRVTRIGVRGPFVVTSGNQGREPEMLQVPIPADCLFLENEHGKGSWIALEPMTVGADEGTTLPAGLVPLQPRTPVKGKPQSPGSPVWPWSSMADWLVRRAHDLPKPVPFSHPEQRTHVSISADSRTASDGRLFTTVGRRFLDDAGLYVETDAAEDLRGVHPIGGESRLAMWRKLGHSLLPPIPENLKRTLCGMRPLRFRVVLATPAPFGRGAFGWCPDWIGEDMTGTPPGASPGLKWRLHAAAVARAVPHSGWDMARRESKPVRWLTPAGSTFFFEMIEGSGEHVMALWLQSLCSREQDRRDGYGLALFGIY